MGEEERKKEAEYRQAGDFFFSRVNFLCRLLFRYPFHPRVTAVARKRPRSPQQHVKDRGHSAKSAGGRLQLNTHASYVCGLHEVTRCRGVCCTRTQNALRWQQFHASAVSTPLGWVFKRRYRKLVNYCRITGHRSESARERRIALYKSDQQ